MKRGSRRCGLEAAWEHKKRLYGRTRNEDLNKGGKADCRGKGHARMLWVVDGGLQEAHVSLRKGTLILTNGMFSEGGERRGTLSDSTNGRGT